MMEVKVFVHRSFLDSCDPELLAVIKKRFTDYKAHGIRHSSFGRDVSYNRPQSVKDSDLWHIHVKDATSKNWSARWIEVNGMISNTALIYTRGFRNPNYYLLISLLANAHQYYGGTEQYLRSVAAIARGFQEIY
jgi:mRNA interferase YafO